MSDVTVEADEFGATIEQLLGRVERGVKSRVRPAVAVAVSMAAELWKENAEGAFAGTYIIGGWGKPGYGREVTAGKYARSIRSRMIVDNEDIPTGEAGSPSMPGLPHLLEKGHAKVGGGSVAGREHIAPAADEAFEFFEKSAYEIMELAIDEA